MRASSSWGPSLVAPGPVVRLDREDLKWIILIAISFAFALGVSWERWGNPLVDCGREMNQPLRLLRGETLYSDLRHIYGPLSPHLNATLYRLFGASLNVLYADGIVTGAIILALVYWLARHLMGRAASATATLSVMWLCAFKPAGNYVLPYAFSALHGSALGLASLALLLRAFRADKNRFWVVAGVLAGLALLAKTEMGVAALVAGVVAAGLTGHRRRAGPVSCLALFAIPALALPCAVYFWIAGRVGWHTLVQESFLLPVTLPPELVYFNQRMFGFDRPLDSLALMFISLLRLGALGGMIAAISLLVVRRRTGGHTGTSADRAELRRPWALLLGSLGVFSGASWMLGDLGPYLAMPLLLVALLLAALVHYWQQYRETGELDRDTLTLIVIGVYALASLARMLLRVRSGGAYSSYLLPASVILFTYCWVYPFPKLLRDARVRRLAGALALGLLLASVVVTAGVLSYRYRAKSTYPLHTPRGTMITLPDFGQAFDEAIRFIQQETSRGDSVAVMPEGTSLNFFTDRRNPLRDEITTPGLLPEAGEKRAIQQLVESNTRVVLIANRPTVEFGAAVFGRDYGRRLMRWVEENFEACAIFGPNKNPELAIGHETFFIRAYCRK